MTSLFGWSSGTGSVDRQDVVLVHLLIVSGIKEAVRRIVDVSITRREANLRRGSSRDIAGDTTQNENSSLESSADNEDDSTVELTERLPEVRNLIQMLELVLWHGLAPQSNADNDSPVRSDKRAANPLLEVQGTGSLTSEASPWGLIQSLEHVNAAAFGATLMLVRMNARATSDRGLTRAWLRQLLNQNALEFTLRALCKLAVSQPSSARQRRNCYEDWAFLRWTNEANRSMLFNLLSALNGIGFALEVSSTNLDAPPPKAPGHALSSQSLVCSMTVEFALAAGQSLEPGAEETILVVSTQDIQASGRYVYLEPGVFANKISGFVLRYCDDYDGSPGWGIFAPHHGQTPLYYCNDRSCTVPNHAPPPLSGWRVISRKDVFESPAILRLRFPAGLATRVLDRNCNGSVKESLMRDEIQALRVEIKQVVAERARLDVLRKTRVNEFQQAKVQDLAKARDHSESCRSQTDSSIDGVDKLAEADKASLLETKGKGHKSEKLIEPVNPDSFKDSGGELANDTQNLADVEEIGSEINSDLNKLGTNVNIEREGESPLSAEENDVENMKEKENNDEMQGEETSAKNQGAILTSTQNVETESSENINASKEYSSVTTTTSDNLSNRVSEVEEEHDEVENLGSSDDKATVDQNQGIILKSTQNVEIESLEDINAPKEYSSVTTTTSGNLSNTVSEVEEEHDEVENLGSSDDKATFDQNQEILQEVDEESNVPASDRSLTLQETQPDPSASTGNNNASKPNATKSPSNECKAASSPTKKKKKKVKLVKVASFGDDSDLSSALISSRHSSRRDKKSSIIAATVYDNPQPTQVVTPKGAEEETEEERMLRFAREEEESLAQYIAEQQQEEQQQKGNESINCTLASHTLVADLSSDDNESHRAEANITKEEVVNELVRKYSRCNDPMSDQALELALRIFKETNYVVGPMPKKESPARSWRGSLASAESSSARPAPSKSPSLDISKRPKARSHQAIDLAFTMPKIISAEVAGQHISRGSDSHVRFVIRVKLERRSGSSHDRVSGDASILNGEESSTTEDDDESCEENPRVAITVQRRFREFRELCADLQRSLDSDVKLPALPKTAWVRSFAEDYIYKKRKALNTFLQQLLTCEWPGPQDRVLAEHALVIEFLTRDSNIHLIDLKKKRSADSQASGSIWPSSPSDSIHISLITEPRADTYKLEQNDSIGLAEQDFKCSSCSRDLSIAMGNKVKGTGILAGLRRPLRKTKRSARFCHYLERWFCPGCFHTGNSSETARKLRKKDTRRTSTSSNSSSSSSGVAFGDNSNNPFATNSTNPFSASNDRVGASMRQNLEGEALNEESESDDDEDDEIDYAGMEDHLRILPTRVLHKWDFDLLPVSHAAATFLDSIWDHPVLCVSASNPALFETVSQLQHARLLRVQLTLARELVEKCDVWQNNHLQLQSPLVTGSHSCAHLARDTELYSLRDLFEMYLGNLIPQLVAGVDHLANHITANCSVCKDRGEQCKVCDDQALIYPFQIMTVVQCRKCKGHFHRGCFKGEDKCVNCLMKHENT